MNSPDIFLKYLQLGFTHVIPFGFDHILFILSLFFLNSNPRSVIIQCSLFTVAHSLSLGLSAAGYLMPNAKIIEPLIAFSILFTSVENIIHDNVNPFRLSIIFLFGLVHGMGFAGAIKDAGLPENNFLQALFSFNLGVELSQVTIILLAYFMAGKWFSKKIWYRERIAYPLSSVIGCIALYWMIDRMI